MVELMDCILAVTRKPNRDELTELVDEIRDSYKEGCLRLTGTTLDEAPEIAGDRRSRQRTVVSIPFYLWPVKKEASSSPIEEEIPEQIAMACNLSCRGIGIQCDHPLKEHFYVAEFDCLEDRNVRLFLEVCWQQKKGPHHYVAGCQILGPLPD
ncbi:MAG TPA: hypothetical protein VNQ76_01535 [Planctomicrobium sp.]|nr:hypothetical protein [Planctomicrobium sp.]